MTGVSGSQRGRFSLTPDFTKVTPEEARLIAQAEQSGFVDEDEVDWNDLSKTI